jgi:NhaP-type Na+/H+ or K+/H+ antiporter
MISTASALLFGDAEPDAYIPSLLHYLAIVPALGVAAQWIAWRTRLPGILLLLLIGIAMGQFFSPDEVIAQATGGDISAGTRVLFPLVSLSVAIILFEGGLSLRLNELREAGTAVLRLVTVGAIITVALTTLSAYYLLDLEWRISLLIGSVLVVTGPTVVSPLLRQIRPSRRIESTLKWEGIVIDPIGAVLAVLVFEEFLMRSDEFDPVGVMVLLIRTAFVGLLLGAIGAAALVFSYRRYWVPDYLQGIMALGTALLLFSLSNVLAEESGLITVTVIGIILANQKQAAIGHVIEFKEHLRTLLIGCLFIVLGSRIEPKELLAVGWEGAAFVAILIVIIRPLATVLSLAGTSLKWNEKLFIGSLAPRGIVAAAVASVFALRLEGETGAQEGASPLVTIVFLVILCTVAVYGLLAGPLARWLGLAKPNPQGLLIAGADHWVRELCKVLHENQVTLLMVDTNYNKISAARMEGLPAECINILSDQALEELNFGNMGRLLALTPNDEVNSLAVQEFRHLFNRAGVFQLSFKSHASAEKRSMAHHLRGRVLFGNDWTFTRIRETVAAGAIFKATKLSDSFLYADYLKRYGTGALLMFQIDGNEVIVNSADRKMNPKSGDILISLVPAVPIPPDHSAVESSSGDSGQSESNESDSNKSDSNKSESNNAGSGVAKDGTTKRVADAPLPESSPGSRSQ